MDKKLMELLEQKEVNKDELEFIEEHEKVVNCSYEGLEFGHSGDYLYHVVLDIFVLKNFLGSMPSFSDSLVYTQSHGLTSPGGSTTPGQ